MTDSLFSRFVEAANYVTDSYNTYTAPVVSKVPYANQIIKASLFATSPIVSVGSNLYQMTETGVSLGSMAAALVDTTIRGYALPFAARASAQMISNITGLNAEMLNIPAQIGAQALYTKAKETFNYHFLMRNTQHEQNDISIIADLSLDLPVEIKVPIENENQIHADAHDLQDNYALIEAIKHRRDDEFQALIQKGVNLDLPDRDGHTALDWAIQSGCIQTVNSLIEKGADLSARNYAVVRNAALGRFPEIVKALIQKIVSQGKATYPKLMFAVYLNDLATVKDLIEAKVDIDSKDFSGKTALVMAELLGQTEITNVLIDAGASVDRRINRNGHTLLINAILKRDYDRIKKLLQAGAVPDLEYSSGINAIRMAVAIDHWAIVNILLQAGANPNTRINENNDTLLIESIKKRKISTFARLIELGAELELKNNDDFAALEIAVFENQPFMFKLLIEAGAKRDHKQLIVSAQLGFINYAILLIQAGYNIDFQDEKGQTPLIWAVQKVHTELAKTLIQEGAKLDLPANNGNTALHIAAGLNNFDILNILMQAGANFNLKNKDGMIALEIANSNYSSNKIYFSFFTKMRSVQILDAVLNYPSLHFIASLFKTEMTNIQNDMFYKLRALIQNAPMEDTDPSATLVRLPLEVKTLILSHLDYPKWYSNKDRDLKRQASKVAEMIEDRQASDDKKVPHQIDRTKRDSY